MQIEDAVKLLSEVAHARAAIEANPGREAGYQAKAAEEALARVVAELADAAREKPEKPEKDYNLEAAYQSLRTKDEQIRGLRAELETLRSAVPDDMPAPSLAAGPTIGGEPNPALAAETPTAAPPKDDDFPF